MSNHCEGCGERIYSRGCTNCNEAGYIIEQCEYLDMEAAQSLIDADSDYHKRMLELGRKI